jgi:glycosyltransferase involved in cell wall biosynthesis
MSAVSVIVPTYNRRDLVLRAAASVLEQTYRDFEVIVVDDGSSDGTAGALESLGEGVRVVRHARNRGVSAARNTGILESSSPLVAFLDSDDRWLPKKLEVQVRFFSLNPGAVACQTREIWIRKGRRVNPARRHVKPSGDVFEASLKRCLVSPSAVMLRRSVLEEAGLFDEDLPVCEDYDLWLRISCRHPVHLIDEDHLVREGGRPDQLSAFGPGMDRFRIRSMARLLEEGSLSASQARATREELTRKCRIYGEGCLKRGRMEEGRYYLGLPALAAQGKPVLPFPRAD